MSEEATAAAAADTTGNVIDYDSKAPESPETTAPQGSQAFQEKESQGTESTEAASVESDGPAAKGDGNDSSEQTDSQEKPVKGVLDAYADEKNDAPLQYEFKDADGAVINNETTALISELAKDLQLSQAAAQKLFERGSGDDGIISKINQNAIRHYNQEWGRQIESDPEIGGARLEDTRFNVAKAMSLDSSGELREFLKNSGLGNFPPLVKFLNQVGAHLNSDRAFITGKPAASQPKKDALASMYTSM